MLRKKIAVVGAFGVGKTSLIRRFVTNEFSEDYISTIGVRIEKHALEVDTKTVELMVWDIAGNDDFVAMRSTYLRGAASVVMVVDGSREWTLDHALAIREDGGLVAADPVWELLVSKDDLPADYVLQGRLAELGYGGAPRTSARTGNNVADFFAALARKVTA